MRLYCFDLDGTLVESALEQVDGKLQPTDYVFTEPVLRSGVRDKVRELACDGAHFAIVTNQGGIAWGYHAESEARLRIARTIAELDFFFGRPFTVHVCYSHPRATIARYKLGHERRKPAPTMIFEAIDALVGKDNTSAHVDVAMIGDLETDEEAARAAAVTFVGAETFFA